MSLCKSTKDTSTCGILVANYDSGATQVSCLYHPVSARTASNFTLPSTIWHMPWSFKNSCRSWKRLLVDQTQMYACCVWPQRLGWVIPRMVLPFQLFEHHKKGLWDGHSDMRKCRLSDLFFIKVLLLTFPSTGKASSQMSCTRPNSPANTPTQMSNSFLFTPVPSTHIWQRQFPGTKELSQPSYYGSWGWLLWKKTKVA